MTGSPPLRRLVVVATLAVSLFLLAEPAAGQMTGTSDVVASYTSDTLQPPASLAGKCTAQSSVALTWVQTASRFASGYQVWAQPVGGGAATLITTLAASSTGVSVTGLARKTGYSFWLLSSYRSWTSKPSGAVTVQC